MNVGSIILLFAIGSVVAKLGRFEQDVGQLHLDCRGPRLYAWGWNRRVEHLTALDGTLR